ncbi:MAG: class I SAM-dependent methyltransferase [Janthinobacterium lividum]
MTTYVHGHDPAVQQAHGRRTVANSAGHLLPSLRPGASVLDVGCGVGSITADLALRVAPGRVVGVDSAEEVLVTARAGVRDRGAQVEFAVADACALPFQDASFDVVHAHQVLQHLADPVAALREMRRVVRADGVVAVRDVDYATTHFHPELPGLVDWLAQYRATARANGGDPDAGSRLLTWARAAGYTRIEPSASVWTFATPQSRSWWGTTWAERTGASTLTTRLRAHGVEEGRIDAMVDAWRRWREDPDGWMTMTHGEILARP